MIMSLRQSLIVISVKMACRARQNISMFDGVDATEFRGFQNLMTYVNDIIRNSSSLGFGKYTYGVQNINETSQQWVDRHLKQVLPNLYSKMYNSSEIRWRTKPVTGHYGNDTITIVDAEYKVRYLDSIL